MNASNKWFAFADEDWLVARQAMTAGIYNQVCFHCQQGVEKLLKGFLYQHQQSIPRTHSLSELLTICATTIQKDLHDLLPACRALDRYYIPTRYPDAMPGTLPDGLPTAENASEALSILDTVRARLLGNAVV